jgi:hypothetical protein
MTVASVSFAGNFTDDLEVRYTERGILDLTEQMRAGPVVDLPVHRRVEQTTAGAALPQGDSTDLAVAPQGEGGPQLGGIVAALTTPPLSLYLRPVLVAVRDERLGATGDAGTLGGAFDRVGVQVVGHPTTAAHRLQDTVGGVTIGGDHTQVLGEIIKSSPVHHWPLRSITQASRLGLRPHATHPAPPAHVVKHT